MAQPGEWLLNRQGSDRTSRTRGVVPWVSVFLVSALTLSALFAPIGRASTSGPEAQAAGSSLRIGALQEPDSLNPNVGVLNAAYVVWAHVYELLVGIGPDLTPIPSLAQSWQVTPDQVNWTFHLVTNAMWHDGVPFTAEDVNFTFRMIAAQSAWNPVGTPRIESGRSKRRSMIAIAGRSNSRIGTAAFRAGIAVIEHIVRSDSLR